MPFAFLSDEWISAAEAIHDEYVGRLTEPPEVVRMNVNVTDVPFGDGTLAGYIDSTEGNVLPKRGTIDDPEATVTVDYDTARALFVTQDYEQVVIAFMSGQIEVEGDVTRLLFLQDLDPSPEQMALGQEVADKLQAITS